MRQDLRLGSLAQYLAWGLSHREQVQIIIAQVQIMMADFPKIEEAASGGGFSMPAFLTSEQPDDSALRQQIMALPDGELTADDPVLNQLFDTSDVAAITALKADGTFIRLFLENLPAIIQAIQLLMSLTQKPAPSAGT